MAWVEFDDVTAVVSCVVSATGDELTAVAGTEDGCRLLEGCAVAAINCVPVGVTCVDAAVAPCAMRSVGVGVGVCPTPPESANMMTKAMAKAKTPMATIATMNSFPISRCIYLSFSSFKCGFEGQGNIKGAANRLAGFDPHIAPVCFYQGFCDGQPYSGISHSLNKRLFGLASVREDSVYVFCGDAPTAIFDGNQNAV